MYVHRSAFWTREPNHKIHDQIASRGGIGMTCPFKKLDPDTATCMLAAERWLRTIRGRCSVGNLHPILSSSVDARSVRLRNPGTSPGTVTSFFPNFYFYFFECFNGLSGSRIFEKRQESSVISTPPAPPPVTLHHYLSQLPTSSLHLPQLVYTCLFTFSGSRKLLKQSAARRLPYLLLQQGQASLPT